MMRVQEVVSHEHEHEHEHDRWLEAWEEMWHSPFSHPAFLELFAEEHAAPVALLPNDGVQLFLPWLLLPSVAAEGNVKPTRNAASPYGYGGRSSDAVSTCIGSNEAANCWFQGCRSTTALLRNFLDVDGASPVPIPMVATMTSATEHARRESWRSLVRPSTITKAE